MTGQSTGNALRWAASTFMIVIVLLFASIPLTEAQTKDFNVPAQSATTGIPEFARQAGIQILVSEPLVRGKRIAAVTGSHTIDEALAILLKGTGLTATSKDGTTYTVAAATKQSTSFNPTASGGALAATEPTSNRGAAEPTSSGPAENPNAAAGATTGLNEIIVTAQKRTERLQDVPISVSVYTQALMDAQGTRQIDDIARLTPGLTFFRGTINNNSESSDIAIRGIDSTAGAATTGIYVDDVPIQSRHLSFGTFNAYPQLFDIDRVEVLRGPQGTLFGSGSEGGTVRFITPEPGLSQYSMYARSELGFTDGAAPVEEIGLAGGGPVVNDELGFRASVSYRHEGGYVDRIDWHTQEIADKDSNAATTKTARLAFKWAANEHLTITPSIYYQYRYVGDATSWWSIQPGTPPPDPTGGQFTATLRNGNEIAQPSTDEFTLSAVRVDWDFGSVRLVSSSSYYKRNQSAVSDYSSVDRAIFLGNPYPPQPVTAPGYWADNQNNWTEEVRLESNDAASRISWTTGVFYQNAKENTIENVYDPALLMEIGQPVADGYIYKQDPFSSVDKQVALFGQADLKATDHLKFTLGLRVSQAKFEGQAFYSGFVVGPPVSSSVSITEHPITPKFGATYQFDPDNLLYATVAKGYRIGGANPDIGQFCNFTPYGLTNVPPQYSSDTVWSYELGTKNTWDDRRLLLDASVYFIKWNNIQQNVALQCGFQFTENLGAANSKGFDVQTQFKVSDALTVGGTFGYTDAYYTQTVFATQVAAETPGFFSIVQDGNHLPAAPWTLALFSQVNFPLFARSGYVRGDYQYSAKQTATIATQDLANGAIPGNVPPIPSTSYASLRAGLKWASFDVSLFAQNLFNSQPKISVVNNAGVPSPLFQDITWRPLTIGMTALYRY
jgi:outer membrane receptor protein involved in Fe transport